MLLQTGPECGVEKATGRERDYKQTAQEKASGAITIAAVRGRWADSRL